MTVFLRALLIFCLLTMASVVTGWAQSAAPPQAAAVGYNTRTFGPDLVLGKNWFVTPGANVTQTTSTSITCAGAGSANHWNDHVNTLRTFGVGGGAYMEATLSWDNPYFGYGMAGSDGWPAWWAWTVEQTTGRADWPGYPGYDNTIEIDFMEAWSDTKMSVLMHNWMTAVPCVATDFHYYYFSNSRAHTQQHKFGFLWVPATATSLGHGSFYFDGQKLAGFDVYWKQYDLSLPPPVYFTDNGQPSGAGTAFSIIDKSHLYLILGTGSGNPMHVTSVEVWQKDGTRNLPATAPVSVSIVTVPAQVTNASFIVSGTMAGSRRPRPCNTRPTARAHGWRCRRAARWHQRHSASRFPGWPRTWRRWSRCAILRPW